MGQDLAKAIAEKSAIVGVIGLGYVGLPLIQAFTRVGFHCMGFDVDQAKVDALNAGRSYIKHIPSKTISDWVEKRQLTPTTDMARLSEADVLLVCVPTPLSDSRDPDLQFVEGTSRSIAKALRPGQLVVLESTTYPTTTRDVMLPILEESGLKVGKDFYLAYSPEREDPGNAIFSASSIPKVVGGMDPKARNSRWHCIGMPSWRSFRFPAPKWPKPARFWRTPTCAVNIALVNELKVLFDRMGLDVWEVIDAAKTKPFGFQAFYPGPGLGGHCIPIDPFYLTWLARKQGMTTRFIELAGEVNSRMPEYVISRLAEFLNEEMKPIKGSKICLLGMAYKKDVDDPRESPSFVLMELLMARGAELTYNDPHVPKLPKMRHHNVPDLASQDLTPEFLAAQDCVLIATDHSAYDYDFIVKHSRLVLDTRNATKQVKAGREKIRKA